MTWTALATATATIKRASGGGAHEITSTASCVPPYASRSETEVRRSVLWHRAGVKTPFVIYEMFFVGTPDVALGDLVVVNGGTYLVGLVEKFGPTPDTAAYLHVEVEQSYSGVVTVYAKTDTPDGQGGFTTIWGSGTNYSGALVIPSLVPTDLQLLEAGDIDGAPWRVLFAATATVSVGNRISIAYTGQKLIVASVVTAVSGAKVCVCYEK